MSHPWNRREFLSAVGAMGIIPAVAAADERPAMRTAPVPATGEALPVIGLGTYSVFDVESSASEIAKRREIVDLLTGSGGSVIDTSPMYNRSERVIGDVTGCFSRRRCGPTGRMPAPRRWRARWT